MAIFKKQSLKVSDKARTNAAELTLRQSIYPLALVTILFFLWVCSFLVPGVLGVTNSIRGSHTAFWIPWISIFRTLFTSQELGHPVYRQHTLGNLPKWICFLSDLLIGPLRAYPLASLGHANWILRHYGYKPVFIWGLCLYGVGALIAWPCILHRSFGGFCAAIFIIGNGLGSLETAANPYITGKLKMLFYLTWFIATSCWHL